VVKGKNRGRAKSVPVQRRDTVTRPKRRAVRRARYNQEDSDTDNEYPDDGDNENIDTDSESEGEDDQTLIARAEAETAESDEDEQLEDYIRNDPDTGRSGEYSEAIANIEDCPSVPTEIVTTKAKDKEKLPDRIAADEEEGWSTEDHPPSALPFVRTPGLNIPVPGDGNPDDFLNLLIPEHFWQLVAEETNAYAQRKMDKKEKGEFCKSFISLQ
jgi:hypothetical protein